MLPVDSPRWAKLETGFGTGESTARALKKMHDCIASTPPGLDELKTALYEVQCECDELYHQQSVYPATAATVPHLVHFVPHLPLKEKIDVLVWIGYVAFEGPDRNVDDDIAEWYQNSTSVALNFAVEIAKRKHESASDLTALFEAIAILWDGGTLYYTFRDYDEYDFQCPHCDLKLLAGFEDNQGYKVSKASDESDADDSLKTLVPATYSVEEELARPEHEPLRFFHDLFVQGDHQCMLRWEQQVLGRFHCPGCNELIPIRYKWGS